MLNDAYYTKFADARLFPFASLYGNGNIRQGGESAASVFRLGVGDGDGVERLERLRIDHDPLAVDYRHGDDVAADRALTPPKFVGVHRTLRRPKSQPRRPGGLFGLGVCLGLVEVAVVPRIAGRDHFKVDIHAVEPHDTKNAPILVALLPFDRYGLVLCDDGVGEFPAGHNVARDGEVSVLGLGVYHADWAAVISRYSLFVSTFVSFVWFLNTLFSVKRGGDLQNAFRSHELDTENKSVSTKVFWISAIPSAPSAFS